MAFQNNELTGKNDILATVRMNINKRKKRGKVIFHANSDMRGNQSVDDYLDMLMTRDRWAEIY